MSSQDKDRGKEVLKEELETTGQAHLKDSADEAQSIQNSEPEDWPK